MSDFGRLRVRLTAAFQQLFRQGYVSSNHCHGSVYFCDDCSLCMQKPWMPSCGMSMSDVPQFNFSLSSLHWQAAKRGTQTRCSSTHALRPRLRGACGAARPRRPAGSARLRATQRPPEPPSRRDCPARRRRAGRPRAPPHSPPSQLVPRNLLSLPGCRALARPTHPPPPEPRPVPPPNPPSQTLARTLAQRRRAAPRGRAGAP